MKKIFLLICAMTISHASFAGEESFDTLNAQIQVLKKASGSFVQRIYDATGVPKQNARGTFKLSKPGQFVWHYQKPFEQKLVSDGNELWVYDVDLDQASKQPLSDYMRNTPLSLLLKNDLNQNFNYINDRTDAANIQWVEVKAKKNNGDFKKIEIGMLHGKIIGMQLTDRLGQNIQLDIINLSADSSISANTFNFTPPSGVDVIER